MLPIRESQKITTSTQAWILNQVGLLFHVGKVADYTHFSIVVRGSLFEGHSIAGWLKVGGRTGWPIKILLTASASSRPPWKTICILICSQKAVTLAVYGRPAQSCGVVPFFQPLYKHIGTLFNDQFADYWLRCRQHSGVRFLKRENEFTTERKTTATNRARSPT